jgi:hypothetical protein
MRLTVPSMERARAFDNIVLPTPGTSSINKCPSARSTVTAVRTTSGLPSITFSMLMLIRLVTEARVSKLLIRSPCRLVLTQVNRIVRPGSLDLDNFGPSAR